MVLALPFLLSGVFLTYYAYTVNSWGWGTVFILLSLLHFAIPFLPGRVRKRYGELRFSKIVVSGVGLAFLLLWIVNIVLAYAYASTLWTL